MNEVSRYRMRVLAIVGLSMFVALGARLWYLQVMVSEEAVATARSNITRVISVPAPRGRILDVNSRVMVGNRTTTVLTMNRHELDEAAFTGDEVPAAALALSEPAVLFDALTPSTTARRTLPPPAAVCMRAW